MVVRNLTVVSPTRLLANVSVNPNAQSGYPQLSLVSGLQLIAQPFAVQILPPARTMWLSGNIVNLATGTAGLSAGSTAVVRIGGAPTSPTVGNLVLHLNDKQIPVLGIAEGQVTFQIPSGTGDLALRC